MVRFAFINPIVEVNSKKTYCFFSGFNVYTGLGVYGIVVGIIGFGFMLEYIRYGK